MASPKKVVWTLSTIEAHTLFVELLQNILVNVFLIFYQVAEFNSVKYANFLCELYISILQLLLDLHSTLLAQKDHTTKYSKFLLSKFL